MTELPTISGAPAPVEPVPELMEITWSVSYPAASDRPALSNEASAPPIPVPDTDLIRLCAEHPGYMAAVKENPDEEEDGSAWRAYERNRDAISAAKPQTLDGMIAKARAAKLEATFWDSSENVHGTMGEPWAWDLVNSLLRLAGEG